MVEDRVDPKEPETGKDNGDRAEPRMFFQRVVYVVKEPSQPILSDPVLIFLVVFVVTLYLLTARNYHAAN